MINVSSWNLKHFQSLSIQIGICQKFRRKNLRALRNHEDLLPARWVLSQLHVLLNKFAQGGASWSGKPSARGQGQGAPRGHWWSLEPKKNRRYLDQFGKKKHQLPNTGFLGKLFWCISNHFNAIIFSRSKDHLLLTIWFNAGGFQPSNGVTLGIESHHGRHRWPSTGCTYQTPSEALGVDKGYSILVEDCILLHIDAYHIRQI